MSVIDSLAVAIARMEGYPKGRSGPNNNPGNLWDKHRSIYRDLPRDDAGFIVFPTPEAGWAAMKRDLQIKLNRGMTLRQVITMWAPPSENDTEGYIRNVAAWTGLPTDVPLQHYAGGLPAAPGPAGAPVENGPDMAILAAAVVASVGLLDLLL